MAFLLAGLALTGCFLKDPPLQHRQPSKPCDAACIAKTSAEAVEAVAVSKDDRLDIEGPFQPLFNAFQKGGKPRPVKFCRKPRGDVDQNRCIASLGANFIVYGCEDRCILYASVTHYY